MQTPSASPLPEKPPAANTRTGLSGVRLAVGSIGGGGALGGSATRSVRVSESAQRGGVKRGE